MIRLSTAILLALWASGAEAAKSYRLFLPAAATVDELVGRSDLPKRSRGNPISFDVDADGRAMLGNRGRFVLLSDEKARAARPFQVPGISVGHASAWMHDGTLLAIEGDVLGSMTQKGFAPILRLPDTGMKVAAASHDECYLYGGEGYGRDLYLYRRGGKLLLVLRAHGTIDAVSGNGERTYVAVGPSIFRLVPDQDPVHVHTAAAPVRSLAMAADDAVFFSTDNGVTYLTEKGLGFTFLQGKGGELRIRGERLYLFVPDEAVMRMGPVGSFEAQARTMKSAISREAPAQ